MKIMMMLMKNKTIGIVLLIVGIGLLFWGYNIYDSAGSQVSRALSGDAPTKAYVLLIGGAICAMLGVLKLK